MYHSINLIDVDTDKTINTYDNWHIVPETRPLVNPPEVVTEYVEIAGSSGSLDYTEALTGGVVYRNRTGSWKFIVENGHQEWHALYNYLLTFLHGQTFKIVLEDDPKYEYVGRLTLNEWNSSQHWSTITINYNLSPYKYLTEFGVSDWLWDDLTIESDAYIIYYGNFDINGRKVMNLYNPSDDEVPVTFTCTSNCILNRWANDNFHLYSGINDKTGIKLKSGDNVFVFEGISRVTISYDRGTIV